MRKVLSISILVLAVMALAAAGLYASGEKSACAKKADATVQKADAKVKAASGDEADSDGKWLTRTISVKGMTSAGCEKSLSVALAKAPGVVEVVKVCHKSEEAVVKVDPAVCQDAELTRAITDKGYEAQIIPAVAKSASAKSGVCPVTGAPCGEASAKETCAAKKAEGTK